MVLIIEICLQKNVASVVEGVMKRVLVLLIELILKGFVHFPW